MSKASWGCSLLNSLMKASNVSCWANTFDANALMPSSVPRFNGGAVGAGSDERPSKRIIPSVLQPSESPVSEGASRLSCILSDVNAD
jgi:hypothetical protein